VAATSAAPSEAPVEEVKLYVGNVSYETDDNRLRELFGPFGTVTDAFVPTDRATGRPRGFAFVTLSSGWDEAISKMDGSEVDGRTIRVNKSTPKGQAPPGGAGGAGGSGAGFNAAGLDVVKLYVGNLAFETNEESVRSLFEQYGAVTDCFLPTDKESGRPRGFAFVSMAAKDAEVACAKAAGADIDGREIRVTEAQPTRRDNFQGGGGGGWGGGGGGGGGWGGQQQSGWGGGGGGGGGGGYSGGGGYGNYNGG
jgi:RNA recognition motif-containing protein